MNCSSHHDVVKDNRREDQNGRQIRDDSTCELSSSTLDASMGGLLVSDLGASLDLNRHTTTVTVTAPSTHTRSTQRYRYNTTGEESDSNLGESFDFLGESFAIDTSEDVYTFTQSRPQMGISMSRLAISMSNLETVNDDIEEDCSMSGTEVLRRSNHSAIATSQHD